MKYVNKKPQIPPKSISGIIKKKEVKDAYTKKKSINIFISVVEGRSSSLHLKHSKAI